VATTQQPMCPVVAQQPGGGGCCPAAQVPCCDPEGKWAVGTLVSSPRVTGVASHNGPRMGHTRIAFWTRVSLQTHASRPQS
jgi:hypothetical protein